MKGYIRVKINRLWHGFASVRDYIVKDAKKRKRGLEIIIGKEFILIPYDKLDECFKNEEIFTSGFNKGLKYSLWDYDWQMFKLFRPEEERLQFDLFTSLKNIRYAE